MESHEAMRKTLHEVSTLIDSLKETQTDKVNVDLRLEKAMCDLLPVITEYFQKNMPLSDDMQEARLQKIQKLCLEFLRVEADLT